MFALHFADNSPRPLRRGFTLVELLVSIAIIGIMASLILVAMYGAQEDAKISRTEAQIAKIHELIMGKWEAYESRPVQLGNSSGTTPAAAALNRLNGLRELQRCELPERKSDVMDPPVVLIAPPTLQLAYLRQVNALTGGDPTKWTTLNQGAECLYLIVSKMQDGDRKVIEYFKEDEIGDTDLDGMPEILDAWGKPLAFLRWAPGFVGLPHSFIQPGNLSIALSDGITVLGDMDLSKDGNAGDVADPFDIIHVDPRWRDYTGSGSEECYKENDPFALYPLIVSAGPDDTYDILLDDSDGVDPAPIEFNYSKTATTAFFPYAYGSWKSWPASVGPALPNDPYRPLPNLSAYLKRPVFMGHPATTRSGHLDNITNHTLNVN